jgi:lipopolysaccharide biosynthesis regulator YciM
MTVGYSSMTPRDKHYLSLQFWDKVHNKNGTEFQAFFETIMEKAFPGFQKIRPYGNEGDKGNDGYRPAEGIYYQAYAPADPSEKEAVAAEKFKDDFEKLKNGWDEISTIKELNFVYNDKGLGVTIKLEGAKAELKTANPDIEFKIFTPKNLEEVFFTLNNDQILSLGFDVDSRNALRIARDQLEKLDDELDKESGEFVLRALRNIKDIIAGQNDEDLLLDYEIVEARTLQKNEKVKEAREKYKSILTKYPEDLRAPLYLAEIYLNNDDFEKNGDLLAQAERISPDYWLLHLEKLIREIRLGNEIATATVDERTFPEEPRARSEFYRIYAVQLARVGDLPRAESFIERALQFNPNKFSNYNVKTSILANKIDSEQNHEKRLSMADTVLKEIENVERRFTEGGALGPRSQSLLNIRKLSMYLIKEDYPRFKDVAKATFELVLGCYLDHVTEKVIVDLTHLMEWPQADFARLQNHLKQAEKPIADSLAKVMVLQFLHKKTLFTEAKKFFDDIKKQNVLDFITAVENKNYDHVNAFLKDDLSFAVDFALAIKEPAELRMRIVESLPDDESVQKDKLFLFFYSEEGNLDKAFEILQKMDLTKLSYIECQQTVRIVQEKKAWDSAIILMEKLLSHEKDKSVALQIKLQLFWANYKLERFQEAIRIGKSVLENPEEAKLLEDSNKETLVVRTVYAYLKRGNAGAKDFIEKYSPLLKSFEGKISAQAEVYLMIRDGENALRSVVEGIKLLKYPSPEQYGMLWHIFSQIGNLLPDFTLDSSEEASPGSFVKLRDQERWFYLGNGDELDATKVSEADEKYAAFIGKKLGDIISFTNKYRSENPELTIENILPIEKYICRQSKHNAKKLTEEQRWDAMEIIEAPITGETIDTKYLIARLEDGVRGGVEVFKLYCEQNSPLALLALSEGGLINAISRIAGEKKGFIHGSAGNVEEMNQQKEVAKRMITGEAFYLDGTSAVMLSEMGLLEKIYSFVSGLKVPQSVISLLFEVKGKYEYMPGQTGHMGYASGKIVISEIDRAKRETIKANFESSIGLLESKPQNVRAISSANKTTAFIEQKVAPSLADACILAQKEGIPVLTEDFYYLKANEIDTNKSAPEYCSSLALLRVLYEQGKLSFEEYLNHFRYLSSYRVRFLPITTEDLEKAVFGDQVIKVVQPEQLRKFNFALTLSEEYGVAPRAAFQMIAYFLIKVLLDDSIFPDMAQRIFAEIVSTFPTKENRKSFGSVLLTIAIQAINQNLQKFIIGASVQEKTAAITNFLKVYGSDELFIPQ